MARFDLSLAELERYAPDVAEPADFDAFWADSIAESRAAGHDPVLSPADTPLSGIRVRDVVFSGFAGDPVRGWLLLPRDADGPLPAVVEFAGYGGGRGLPHERLAWVAAGHAHFIMDTRGQGSAWGGAGATGDPHGSGPAFPGFMTRGILDPSTYYYRRVFVDAVLAVELVRSLPEVDPGRIAVAGASQGGGIALAAAALSEGPLVAALPDVPFLCHFERSVGLTDSAPYSEVAGFLRVHRDAGAAVFRTLSYFDGVNMAKRATAPALFSVGLMDTVTPPSSIFAAYNRYAGDKEIAVYDFNEHEGGAPAHWPVQAAFLARTAGS